MPPPSLAIAATLSGLGFTPDLVRSFTEDDWLAAGGMTGESGVSDRTRSEVSRILRWLAKPEGCRGPEGFRVSFCVPGSNFAQVTCTACEKLFNVQRGLGRAPLMPTNHRCED